MLTDALRGMKELISIDLYSIFNDFQFLKLKLILLKMYESKW